MDLFFLAKSQISSTRERQSEFRNILETDLKLKPPAPGGVFEEPLPVEKIREIGGPSDDNASLTIRMLLLLEGEWVFNEAGLHEVRRTLLEEYHHYEPQEDRVCMFLLNDVIRFWRTMCIDMEHKVRAQDKARDIRLIKLRFSWMLLYVSGVLAIGTGYGLTSAEKVERLQTLLGEPPIDRIRSVVGENADQVLDLYAGFLRALDNFTVRQALEACRDSPEFADLSDKAGRFRDSLHSMLEGHFAGDNPTLRALLL